MYCVYIIAWIDCMYTCGNANVSVWKLFKSTAHDGHILYTLSIYIQGIPRGFTHCDIYLDNE